jgi:hypothetical protein
MLPQPAVPLGLMNVEIVHDHVQFALGISRHDFVHEGEEIPAATPLKVPRLHLSGGHFQGRQQGGSAMPFVLAGGAEFGVIELCGLSTARAAESRWSGTLRYKIQTENWV